jgi:hypothetical protein
VRLDPGNNLLGAEISLPYYLKVQWSETKHGRDYFQILEGPYKGKKATVKRKSATESWLVPSLTLGPAATVHFSGAEQSISYGSKGPFSAFSGAWDRGTDHFTAIPSGHYEINMPDKTRSGYYRYTKFHKTWFRIGNFTNRYLHVGVISEGCVTVRPFVYDSAKDTTTTGPFPPDFSDLRNFITGNASGGLGLPYPASMPPALASWDDLYIYLIRSRLNDKAVGTLFVK